MERTAQKAQMILVQYAPPGGPVLNIGVVMYLPDSNRLYLRFTRDWHLVAAREDDAEVLALMEDHLLRMIDELGGVRTLEVIDEWSNTLRVSDFEEITVVDDPVAQIDRLFERHVQRPLQDMYGGAQI